MKQVLFYCGKEPVPILFIPIQACGKYMDIQMHCLGSVLFSVLLFSDKTLYINLVLYSKTLKQKIGIDMKFYDIPVSKVIKDTPESVLIKFDLKNGLREKFAFKAGQYLTLEKKINNEIVRRCYSLCSAPFEDELTIAVKWIKDGIVSESLKGKPLVGQTISVGTPDGNFIVEPDGLQRRNHYFIAAGSGITPIMSMMKTVLAKEPFSKVYLLYGNKDEDTMMLKDKIIELQEQYEGKFFLENCFSCLNAEVWADTYGEMDEFKGRISPQVIDVWLQKYPAGMMPSEYYVCGPGELIQETISHLSDRGIKETNIHTEYFTVGKKIENENERNRAEESEFAPTDRATVTVILDGEEIVMDVGQEMTILEAVEQEGYYPPFSCRSGTCSTCMAKCESGKVEMDVDLGLMPDEKEEGFILTCQSRVASKDIKINYDY